MRVRVLHTVHSVRPEVGGPSQSVPSLVRALRETGVDALLWTSHQRETRDTHPDLAAPIGSLAQAIERLQPVDMIHDHGIWLRSNHRAATLATSRGIARVVSPRGMLEPPARQLRGWRKRAAWALYQRRDLQTATFLHATHDREKQEFPRLGLTPPAVVIPNGVDVPACHQRPGGAGHRTALYLGRIHPIKGLPELIEAWARVAPRGWRMRVVGPGAPAYRADVAALIETAGLGETWHLEGPVDGEEKWRLLREADLFILPTRSESFGMAVAEALACGVPVLTTTGAPWSGLVTRRCGWWVHRSPAALAAALSEAVALRPDQRQAMGARGRAWMTADFGWKEIGRRMAGAYAEILDAA